MSRDLQTGVRSSSATCTPTNSDCVKYRQFAHAGWSDKRVLYCCSVCTWHWLGGLSKYGILVDLDWIAGTLTKAHNFGGISLKMEMSRDGDGRR